MKILLHACCGPCATYPVMRLREQGHQLTGYFNNPNIHPYKEFKHRLDTFNEYAAKAQLPVIVDAGYELEDFITAVVADIPGRCVKCYEMRLRKAAQIAKEQGCDAFSTTLLVSPYQKHEAIREVAERVAEQEGILFYYEDFRPGFRQGTQMAIDMGLYRQPYCGCIFSEKERYYKPKRVKEECRSLSGGAR